MSARVCRGALDAGDATSNPRGEGYAGWECLLGSVAGARRGAWGAPGLEATDRADPRESQAVRSSPRRYLVAARRGPQ